ncbi:MAG: diacylglycerol kinase family protein [Patescibacteria group bacterium]|jgi:hypothetical protein
MHVYIYDTFLSDKKFARTLAKIEARITDLGLSGKVGRLGVTKKTFDLVKDEIKRGAKTIIAVGNDETVEKIVRCMPGAKTPLGIIPIGKENRIAESLGIPSELEACDILSARRVEKIGLGVIGDFYFLSKISTTSDNLKLQLDSGYSVELKRSGPVISIVNLPTADIALPEGFCFSPQDGLLRLLIEAREKKNVIFSRKNFESVFAFSKATVKSAKPIIFNDLIKVSGAIEIEAKKNALSVIVGKNRKF